MVLFLVALLLLVADQLTKLWIRSNLEIGESLFKFGFFEVVRYAPNTGAAFGLFPGHTLALVVASVVGIAFILFYAFYAYRRYPYLDSSLSRAVLGLILGGTIGNLIERLRYLLGQLEGVTDFISLGWWPAFNLADAAVVVGTVIFVCSLIPLARKL